MRRHRDGRHCIKKRARKTIKYRAYIYHCRQISRTVSRSVFIYSLGFDTIVQGFSLLVSRRSWPTTSKWAPSSSSGWMRCMLPRCRVLFGSPLLKMQVVGYQTRRPPLRWHARVVRASCPKASSTWALWVGEDWPVLFASPLPPEGPRCRVHKSCDQLDTVQVYNKHTVRTILLIPSSNSCCSVACEFYEGLGEA